MCGVATVRCAVHFTYITAMSNSNPSQAVVRICSDYAPVLFQCVVERDPTFVRISVPTVPTVLTVLMEDGGGSRTTKQ